MRKKNPYSTNTVVNTNTLTVVAVESPTTVFKEDQFLHGFGYDLARNYAQSLNVKLDFKIVTDNATALKWVQQGKANLCHDNRKLKFNREQGLMSFSASCGDIVNLQKMDSNPNLSWVFKQADDPLTQTASGFVCQKQTKWSNSATCCFL